MKAIVIEGGGSFGAYTAGRVCAAERDYDIAVGSSTGALIAPFALLKDYTTLRRCYTETTNKDIYTSYPFWGGGIPNVFKIVKAYIKGKTGMTDSRPLRRLIERCFTPDHYDAIINSDKQLFITVCELNANEEPAKYISVRDHSYEEFCDLLWASTLYPGLVESLVVDRGGTMVELVDGGTVENVGLSGAIKAGATSVGVYLHGTKKTGYKEPGKNLIHNTIRSIYKQREALSYKNLQKIISDNPEIAINPHFLPRTLPGAKIMEFRPEIMAGWFEEGRLNP